MAGYSPDVVILAAGDPLPASLLDDVAEAVDGAALAIAADGGLRHAARADRDVHVLVGDLDSVAPDDVERARTAGTEVIVHPTTKDATDLELALDLVRARWTASPRPEVLVIGGHGGRTDHLLANVLVLTSERYATLRLTAWLGTEVVHVVRDRAVIDGPVGATVTLLAVHGDATGVTTTGLAFPLDDALLAAGSSRGVSNRLVAPSATVEVRSGVLAVVRSDPPRGGGTLGGAADGQVDGDPRTRP